MRRTENIDYQRQHMRPQINLTGQKGVQRKYGGSLFRKCLIHFCVNVTLCLIYLSTMCLRSEINFFLSSDDLNTETSCSKTVPCIRLEHQKVYLETWKLGATSFGVIYKPSNTSLTHSHIVGLPAEAHLSQTCAWHFVIFQMSHLLFQLSRF